MKSQKSEIELLAEKVEKSINVLSSGQDKTDLLAKFASAKNTIVQLEIAKAENTKRDQDSFRRTGRRENFESLNKGLDRMSHDVLIELERDVQKATTSLKSTKQESQDAAHKEKSATTTKDESKKPQVRRAKAPVEAATPAVPPAPAKADEPIPAKILGTIQVEIRGMDAYLNHKVGGMPTLIDNASKKITYDDEDNMTLTQNGKGGDLVNITASVKQFASAGNEKRQFEDTVSVKFEVKKMDKHLGNALASELKQMTRGVNTAQIEVKSVQVGDAVESSALRAQLNGALKGENVHHHQRRKSESAGLPSWTQSGLAQQADKKAAAEQDATEQHKPPTPGN